MSELPLSTVEAFHAFDRQLAKNTSVRTTLNIPKTFQTSSQFVNCVSLENFQCSKNVPETFQTRSQFVSDEADAERGNQVLTGKETFTMGPGACDGALSHCALPVPMAHHNLLRIDVELYNF